MRRIVGILFLAWLLIGALAAGKLAISSDESPHP